MKERSLIYKLAVRYLLALACCGASPDRPANATTVYFSDDFGSGLAKWSVGGDSWQLNESLCRSPNHCVSDSPEGNYPPNANSTLTMRMSYRTDLSDADNPVLTFWHRIGVYRYDHGYVEISEDNGFTWKALTSFTDTWRSTWSLVQIDLSAYRSSPIRIRFRLRANGNQQSWGWDIDDVEIKETDTGTTPFPFFDDFDRGLDNWKLAAGDAWQLTELVYRDPNHCISESPGAAYPSRACSDLILARPIDLSSSVHPVLTFWHRTGVYRYDYGYVEISEDDGTTWTELTSFTDTWRSTWSFEQIDLSAYGSSRILIRFRLRADGSQQSWGWDIDDVAVKERDTETIPFPFFDDFESGLDNWMLAAGDAWKLTESHCRSATHAISESPDADYPPRACSDLMLAHPIDLSSSVFPVLTFWHKIGLHRYDHGYVQISEDGGTTWTELTSFTNMWLSTWSFEQIDLSPYRSSHILIRFRLRADGSQQSWGWDIDDVEIRELFYPVDPLIVQITDLDTSACPAMRATVIVTDAAGVAVTGLDASAFFVYEDDQSQAPVTVDPSAHTIHAGLALDYSGSMGHKALIDMELAAQTFVDCMAPDDGGEVIKFANGIELMQEHTDDRSLLTDAIHDPTTCDPNATSLYDAVYQGISGVAERPHGRAVIAMSDGKDTNSQHSATEIIAYARSQGVPVFTVGLGGEVDEDVLKAIAVQTGGVYYFAPSSDDLMAIYRAIAGTLKSQYVVTYETTVCDPNNAETREHDLEILVVTPEGAYGQGAKRFRCPPLGDPAMDSNDDDEQADLATLDEGPAQ